MNGTKISIDVLRPYGCKVCLVLTRLQKGQLDMLLLLLVKLAAQNFASGDLHPRSDPCLLSYLTRFREPRRVL